MKKLLLSILSVLTLSTAFSQDLPNTVIKDMNGSQLNFNETHQAGKVTVYSFWATWCVPCKQEINNIKTKLEGWKKEADFDFIAISIDDARYLTQIKTYTKAKGWTFPVYHDANGDLKQSLNFQDIPFAMIVDKDGKIVYRHPGYQEGGEDQLFDEIKKYAKK